MAYHSPLSCNFKLEASMSAANILQPKEKGESDKTELDNWGLNNGQDGNGNLREGGSKKRKRKFHKKSGQGSASRKHFKRNFSHFLKNPSTPEFLLDDRRICPVKRNELDDLENFSSTQLRNVIRECLYTCFNFFHTNINHNVDEIVRTAIARSWAAVDLMTYQEIVRESLKKNSKLPCFTKHTVPPPHFVQEKEMQTDVLEVNNASTMTDELYTMNMQDLSRMVSAWDEETNLKVWCKTPAVLINGFEAKDMIKFLLTSKNLMNLHELGLEGLIKVKTFLNKSTIITVTGTTAQAESLCSRLEKVMEGFNLKMYVLTTVILYNFDKLTATEKILQVLSSITGTPVNSIIIGKAKTNQYDKINLKVICPVTAARKMISVAPFKVENSSVTVRIISDCPVTCMKCLMNGHTRANCTSQVDRSNLCFRCGSKTHLSRDCNEALCCPVCKDLSRATDHLVGSSACVAAYVPMPGSDALST